MTDSLITNKLKQEANLEKDLKTLLGYLPSDESSESLTLVVPRIANNLQDYKCSNLDTQQARFIAGLTKYFLSSYEEDNSLNAIIKIDDKNNDLLIIALSTALLHGYLGKTEHATGILNLCYQIDTELFRVLKEKSGYDQFEPNPNYSGNLKSGEQRKYVINSIHKLEKLIGEETTYAEKVKILEAISLEENIARKLQMLVICACIVGTDLKSKALEFIKSLDSFVYEVLKNLPFELARRSDI